MREQLIQYVELLFAGTPNTEEIKQEILQNTLDRYDDLMAQGKAPEAAYRLAISGIGDINEILGSIPVPDPNPQESEPIVQIPEPTEQPQEPARQAPEQPVQAVPSAPEKGEQRIGRGNMILIALIVIFALMLVAEWVDEDAALSLCGIGFIAVVAVLVLKKRQGKSKNAEPVEKEEEDETHPETALQKSIGTFIWVIGLAAYFIISFVTYDWHVTWVIFLLTAGVNGLMRGYMDYQLGGNPVKAKKALRKGINGFIWMVGLSVYFLLSFATYAWAITWLIFPIVASICGLIHACFDLKGAIDNEN